MPRFDPPKSGDALTSLGPVVQSIAKNLNGLNGLRFEPGDDWDFQWNEGGAVITYPQSDDGDGGGGDALGPLVFAGMSAGTLKYFRVNAEETTDGTGAVNSP